MFRGWKTITFNLLMLVASILEATEVINALPEPWDKFAPAVAAVINIILRDVTAGPVGYRKRVRKTPSGTVIEERKRVSLLRLGKFMFRKLVAR